MQYAIQISKNRKGAAPDNIPTEFLKVRDDGQLSHLTKVINKIYETGEIPKDWLKSVVISLYRKNNPMSCDDYRMTSLMIHKLT